MGWKVREGWDNNHFNMQITANNLSWKAFMVLHLVVLMCATKIPHSITLPPPACTGEAKQDTSQNSDPLMILTEPGFVQPHNLPSLLSGQVLMPNSDPLSWYLLTTASLAVVDHSRQKMVHLLMKFYVLMLNSDVICPVVFSMPSTESEITVVLLFACYFLIEFLHRETMTHQH